MGVVWDKPISGYASSQRLLHSFKRRPMDTCSKGSSHFITERWKSSLHPIQTTSPNSRLTILLPSLGQRRCWHGWPGSLVLILGSRWSSSKTRSRAYCVETASAGGLGCKGFHQILCRVQIHAWIERWKEETVFFGAEGRINVRFLAEYWCKIVRETLGQFSFSKFLGFLFTNHVLRASCQQTKYSYSVRFTLESTNASRLGFRVPASPECHSNNWWLHEVLFWISDPEFPIEKFLKLQNHFRMVRKSVRSLIRSSYLA